MEKNDFCSTMAFFVRHILKLFISCITQKKPHYFWPINAVRM